METDCPETLFKFHPWRYQNLTRHGPGELAVGFHAISRMVGLDDFHRYLSTSTLL